MGFYFFEKLINIIQTWRSRRNLRARKISPKEGKGEVGPTIVMEGHEVSDKVKGETKYMAKYSSYCVADLQAGAVTGGEYQQKNNNEEKVIISQHEVRGPPTDLTLRLGCVRFLTTVTLTPTPTFTPPPAPCPARSGWSSWGTGYTTSRTGWPSGSPSPLGPGAESPPVWPSSATSFLTRLV